jgi:hypothetical protein
LQPIAKSYANRTHDRYSLRSFFAYDKLSGKVGHETASRLIFGAESRAIMEAVKISTALGGAEGTVDAGIMKYDMTSTKIEMGE